MTESKPMQNTRSTQFSLPFWRQLGWRLTLAFILLGILPVLIVTYVILIRTNAQARSQIYDQLDSVAELKSDQITRWLDEGNLAMDTLLSGSNAERFTDLAAAEFPSFREQTAINNILAGATRTGYFNRLFIYTTEGLITASSDRADLGKDISSQPYFDVSLHADYVQAPFNEPAANQLVMYITRPLRSDKVRAVGVLAGELNIDSLAEIMTERTGLGESGETYLVSLANNHLMTPSRFEGYAATDVYHSDGIDRALDGERGRGAYNGYRTVAVFGSYRFIPELEAGLLAEIEQSQALGTFRQVQVASTVIALIAMLTALIVGILVSRSISRPIRALTTSAQRIGSGELRAEVGELQRQDEIGVLARAFHQMQAELAASYEELEQRVADRTQALATSTEISRRLSTIFEQKRLVTEVVEQVRNSFNYYHAQIYFYNQAKDELVMAGGTGEAGQVLLARGHSIPKDQGLVGRAAESNTAVLVSDTSKDPNWLPNPLLPETKSEAAIPISIGEAVMGVLDVQHNLTDGLKQEDVDLLQSIASQVAIAMQNIASAETVAKRAVELQNVATISTAAARIRHTQDMLAAVVRLTQSEFGFYHVHIFLHNPETAELKIAACGWPAGDPHEGSHETTVLSLEQQQSLVARAARTRQPVIINDVRREPGWLPNPLLPHTAAELAVPLIVGDQLLGVLDVQSEQRNAFTDEDANILTTLATQTATALQNAMSYVQAQRQADRESRLNNISQKIQSATTIEMALQTAVRELGHALGRKTTRVKLARHALPKERGGSK